MAHHRDRYQAWRLALWCPYSTIGRRINKRLEGNPAPRLPQKRQDALPILRVQSDHCISSPDRAFGGTIASRPRTERLYRGHGGFGDNIGDAERACDGGTQPVRRFVIDVVGEPEFGRKFRNLSPKAQTALGDPLTERGKPRLTEGIAGPLLAA